MWRINGFASGSCVAYCAAVFGFYEGDSHFPPSLFAGPRPLWFFPIPKGAKKLISRGNVLTTFKRSRPNRRTWWRSWREMISSSASDHGNPAGIAVSMQKGITSKKMETNRYFCKWLSYGRRNSGTFG